MRNPGPIVRASVAGTALVFALAACGGGGDNSSPPAAGGTGTKAPTAAATAWPKDPCGILSEAAVGGAVGEPVSAEPFTYNGCKYSGTQRSSITGAVIQYYNEKFECEGAEKRDTDARIVNDVGAHAAFAAGNTDEVLAVTLEDGRCFMVHGTYAADHDGSRIAIGKAVAATQ